MKNKIVFIKLCYYFGAAIDLLASIVLLHPEAADKLFGIQRTTVSQDYLYASRIGASLMLGWTCLLVWAGIKPIERKGILLITLFPVLAGLLCSSVLSVLSGFINIGFMFPLWIIYVVIIHAYLTAYLLAGTIHDNQTLSAATLPPPLKGKEITQETQLC